MPRLLLISVVALALGTTAAAAPVPVRPAKDIPFEFPTRASMTWAYRTGASTRHELVVVSADRRDGATRLGRYYLNGWCGSPTFPLSVTTEGVAEVWPDGERPILQFPLRAGSSWKSEDTTFTVRGVEPVAVPAGKYDAVRVDEETAVPNGTVKGISWWVSGVGLVRQTRTAPGQEPVVTVLESFKPGK